jgi:hypothetical protein
MGITEVLEILLSRFIASGLCTELFTTFAHFYEKNTSHTGFSPFYLFIFLLRV